ncbi:MAG TPA: hypothetical protein PKD12_23165 [Nitrospira sp.]|nr:hypothetical protein [Nitrospira sp.]
MNTERLLLFVVQLSLVGVVCYSTPAHGEEFPGVSRAQPSSSNPSSIAGPERAGLQAASWGLTIPYGAAKMVYAIGGGIVGGLAWVLTGGDMEVAKSIWIPSMTGDYIVQPQHLTGDKHLYFVGTSSEELLSIVVPYSPGVS